MFSLHFILFPMQALDVTSNEYHWEQFYATNCRPMLQECDWQLHACICLHVPIDIISSIYFIYQAVQPSTYLQYLSFINVWSCTAIYPYALQYMYSFINRNFVCISNWNMNVCTHVCLLDTCVAGRGVFRYVHVCITLCSRCGRFGFFGVFNSVRNPNNWQCKRHYSILLKVVSLIGKSIQIFIKFLLKMASDRGVLWKFTTQHFPVKI